MTVDVSLIMAAWEPNVAWLMQAVTSALDEHACDVELIVVDDGSAVPVAEQLATFDDPRLRVIRIQHGGPYAARNAGLAHATGAFIRFVDADDVVEPQSTAALLELARMGDGAIAYGATVVCDDALVPQKTVTSSVEGDATQHCVLGYFTVYHVSMLFPREALDRAGRWEETAFRVSGDFDMQLRALEHAPVRALDAPVTRYRRHARSVSRTARVEDGAAARGLVLDRYFARHPEQRGTELERRAYGRLHRDRARAHAFFGDRRPAARHAALALRRDPAGTLDALARRIAARCGRVTLSAVRRVRLRRGG